MDERYNDDKIRREKRHSYTNEPRYENEPTSEDIDELFSQRNTQNKVNPKNARFSVSIPDDEVPQRDASASSQSRVPKGRPVGDASQSHPDYVSRDINGRPISSSQNGLQHPKPYQTQQNANRVPVSPAQQAAPQINRPPVKKKKKKKTGKKIAVSILCVFLALLIALFGYGYSVLGKINYDTVPREPNKYINSSELMKSDKVKNILFIGSDARSEIAGMRSDTMMLCSIDTAHKNIKLTSFLRDSYVCIPSTSRYRKLNAACSAGGQQLVIDTIEYNFKVKIDSYVLVDFEAFTKFIDTLGGLDIDGVTEKEANYLIKNVKGINIKPGKNHLTGGATLWYSRIRYLDDDFHRTERQRKVISALISQVAKTNPATLMKAIDTVMPMISTDISRNEFVTLGIGAAVQYLHYDIKQHQIPADGTWSNARVPGDGAVLKMNIDENVKLLKEFIYS